MLPWRETSDRTFLEETCVKRKFNLVIPALVAGILAGCSGGNTTPDASGTDRGRPRPGTANPAGPS